MVQKQNLANLSTKKNIMSRAGKIYLRSILGGILCIASMTSRGVEAATAATTVPYTGVNDTTEVLSGLSFVESGNISNKLYNIYKSGSSLYITPGNVIVNVFATNNSVQRNNEIAKNVKGHILGGYKNKLNSNNITIIAGESNEISLGCTNSVILGGNGNTLTCSSTPVINPITYACGGGKPTGEGYKLGATSYGYGHTPSRWTYTNSSNLGACEYTCDVSKGYGYGGVGYGGIIDCVKRTYACGGEKPTGVGYKLGATSYEYGHTPSRWTYTSRSNVGACEYTCDVSKGYGYGGVGYGGIIDCVKRNSCTDPQPGDNTKKSTEIPSSNKGWTYVSNINATLKACEWTCANSGYVRDGNTMNCKPKIQTGTCTGLPANATWVNDKFKQTWNGSAWTPSSKSAGATCGEPSSVECSFKCNNDYGCSTDKTKCEQYICTPEPSNSTQIKGISANATSNVTGTLVSYDYVPKEGDQCLYRCNPPRVLDKNLNECVEISNPCSTSTAYKCTTDSFVAINTGFSNHKYTWDCQIVGVDGYIVNDTKCVKCDTGYNLDNNGNCVAVSSCPAPTITNIEVKKKSSLLNIFNKRSLSISFDLNGADANAVFVDTSKDQSEWSSSVGASTSPRIQSLNYATGYVRLKTICKNGKYSNYSDIVKYSAQSRYYGHKFYNNQCLDWVVNGLYSEDGKLLATISKRYEASNCSSFGTGCYTQLKIDYNEHYNPSWIDKWYFLDASESVSLGQSILSKLGKKILPSKITVYSPSTNGTWQKLELKTYTNPYWVGYNMYVNSATHNIGSLDGSCYK